MNHHKPGLLIECPDPKLKVGDTFPDGTDEYLHPDDTMQDALLKILRVWQRVSNEAVVVTTVQNADALFTAVRRMFPGLDLTIGLKLRTYIKPESGDDYDWLADMWLARELRNDLRRLAKKYRADWVLIDAEGDRFAQYFNGTVPLPSQQKLREWFDVFSTGETPKCIWYPFVLNPWHR